MLGVPGECVWNVLGVFREVTECYADVPGSLRECMEDPRVLRECGVRVLERYEGGWSAGVCKYV